MRQKLTEEEKDQKYIRKVMQKLVKSKKVYKPKSYVEQWAMSECLYRFDPKTKEDEILKEQAYEKYNGADLSRVIKEIQEGWGVE